MRLRTVLAGAVALAATMTFPTMASGATTDEALWASSQTGNATTVADCGTNDGSRSVTDDGFCVIDDFQGAVELGVRFTTSRAVSITGVRVYRFDQGTVTGSLWKADGTKLATGNFAPWSGTGWQDLLFATPVPIEPGQTYVASYNAPNSDYAFEWYYFADQSRTVGPITALQSTEAEGNGVYCYVGETCNMFPSNTYRNTNYWVTPLWSRYDFTGFFQPVDVDKLNVAKAGRAIPVKFSLGGDMGLGILRDGYPKATRITCATSTATGEIEGTTTAGSSSLSYDADADEYTYVWKSSKAWSNSCYRFELGLDDGSSHTFDVMFTR
jgi:hypothetical protein